MRVPRASPRDETRQRAVNGNVACVSGRNRQAKSSREAAGTVDGGRERTTLASFKRCQSH